MVVYACIPYFKCSEQLCAYMSFGALIECFGQSFAWFDPDQTIMK